MAEPGVHLRLMHAHLRSRAAYPVSLAMQVAGLFAAAFAETAEVVFIYRRVPAFAGWTLPETAFLVGTSIIALRLGDQVAGQVEYVSEYIRTGRFDSFLMRPLGSLAQVFSSDLSIRHLGGVAGGFLVLAWAIPRAGIDWTIPRAIVAATMVISGTVIFCGIWVVTNSIAFWITDAREVANSFTYGGGYVANFPLHIFGRWMRRMLTVVLPIGFVNYLPARYVLGKAGPGFASFGAPVVAVATALVARTVWGVAVRRYRSTGS